MGDGSQAVGNCCGIVRCTVNCLSVCSLAVISPKGVFCQGRECKSREEFVSACREEAGGESIARRQSAAIGVFRSSG